MALPFATRGTLIADKGQDSDAIRADLIAGGITPMMPGRPNRKPPIRCSRTLHRMRNAIERALGSRKTNRSNAAPHDELASGSPWMRHSVYVSSRL